MAWNFIQIYTPSITLFQVYPFLVLCVFLKYCLGLQSGYRYVRTYECVGVSKPVMALYELLWRMWAKGSFC